MALRLITEPAAELATLDEAKEFCEVDHSDRDDLIETLIRAARKHLEKECRIAIGNSVWEVALDAFPAGAISLPMSPIISVESIKYDDGDGLEVTMDVDDYEVDASGQYGWAVPAASWPTALSAANAVRVRFRAGFDPVPDDLKVAVLMLVSQWFDNRESVAVGDSAAALPFAVEALASPYRVPLLV